MAEISVIVPVYNVRDYLKKCVDSVLAQSYNDWELILVDDGSLDGSGELCDALAAEDERIRVLHQANAGVGPARNAGLDASGGRYILFLDSDDSYEPFAFERLLNLAESTHADLAAAGAVCVDEHECVTRRYEPHEGVYSDRKEMLENFFLHSDGLYSCWGKLFRADLIREIRFQPYTRAEDALFCAQTLSRCRVFAMMGESLYRYFRRSDSVTMSTVRAASADQVRAWEQIYALLEREAPCLCSFAARKLIHDVDRLSEAYAAQRPEGWRQALDYLRGAHERWYLRQHPAGQAPAKARLAAWIYRMSPALYYRIAGHKG